MFKGLNKKSFYSLITDLGPGTLLEHVERKKLKNFIKELNKFSKILKI